MQKIKNKACRFKFVNLFSKEALVAESLSQNMPEGLIGVGFAQKK